MNPDLDPVRCRLFVGYNTRIIAIKNIALIKKNPLLKDGAIFNPLNFNNSMIKYSPRLITPKSFIISPPSKWPLKELNP